MNTSPTTDVIDNMASNMHEAAKELRRMSARMKDNGDIEIAADAVNLVTNLIPNLRLDLLVTRPLRALNEMKREQP